MVDWPLDSMPGNHSLPPLDAAGQSTSRADEQVKRQAASGQVSRAMAHVSKHRCGARRGDMVADRPPDARYGKSTGPLWDAAG